MDGLNDEQQDQGMEFAIHYSIDPGVHHAVAEMESAATSGLPWEAPEALLPALGLGLLGMAAGLLTTLAGLGGGLVMTLVLAAIIGPQSALALAAPALLLGNVHRIWLFRDHIDGPLVLPFIAGAVPGALLGGILTVALPEWFLKVSIALAMTYAVARHFKWIRYAPTARALVPMTFLVGLVTATSGGGGLLLGPLLLATGAQGGRFVVSASIIAASIHVTRGIAYGAGGLIAPSTLAAAAVLGLAIIAGNTLGKRARLSDRRRLTLTHVVLSICVLVTVAGLR